MTITVLPASEVRNRMAYVLTQLGKVGGPCLVTRNGKAVAALLSIDAYNQLLSDLEDRLDETDEPLRQGVEEARRQFQRGEATPLRKMRQ